MVDNIQIFAFFVAGLMIALELSFYAFWRSKLYSLYLDYYNRKNHPLVPEAWREISGAYTIEFWLEWKMFFSPVVPEMGAELIRRLRRQKFLVLFYYLPVLIFYIWVLYQSWPDILHYIRSIDFRR